MSAGGDKYTKKNAYVARVIKAFESYPKLMIVSADNVRSKQFQAIRASIRPQSEIIMGKNTLMRRAINAMIKKGRTELKEVLPYIKKNVGLVFVGEKVNLRDIKKVFEEMTIGAPAKQGQTAQCEVVVPPGPTGLEPTMTSFLQAVGISSKIVKGQIDVLSEVVLFREGDRVSASAAALCLKLKITPFKYGLIPVICAADGAVFSAKVLDITEEDVIARFKAAVNDVAAVSLQIGYPTAASVPHSFNDAFKNVLAVALATDYTFKAAEELKALLSDPEAMAKLAAAAASAGAAAGGAAAPAAEEKKEEEEEEADIGGGGLFGDDGDDW